MIQKNDRKANRLLILRGFCQCLTMVLTNYGLHHVLLGEGLTLYQLTPCFVSVLSLIFLKEKIQKSQILFIFLNMIGAIFIVKPSFIFSSFGFELEETAD